MAKKKLKKKLKKFAFNPIDVTNQLQLYTYDIDFVVSLGRYIIDSFRKNDYSEYNLTCYLRGYIFNSVMTLCRMKELLEVIIKIDKLNLENKLIISINEFTTKSHEIISFRNQYVAHPLQDNYDSSTRINTQKVLPKESAKILLQKFFNITGSIENKQLMELIIQKEADLHSYKNLICQVINSINLYSLQIQNIEEFPTK